MSPAATRRPAGSSGRGVPKPPAAVPPPPPRRRANTAGPLVGLAIALAGGGLAQLDSAEHTTRSRDVQPSAVTAAVDELLGQLEVAPESQAVYSRTKFRHWSDLDQDGCNTREEVLIAEKREGRTEDCRVVDGSWFSTYDGITVTDPGDLDIDHVVALGEAWDSGADQWNDDDGDRRERYANDLGYRNSLIAVTATSNRQKGDKDPTDWIPPRKVAWCRYATAWTTVKIRWGLTADPDEIAALRTLFAQCRTAPPTTVTPVG